MKNLFLIAFILIGLSACDLTKPQEKAAQEQARQAGLTAVNKPRFDATFISSAVNFALYKKLKVDDLDLTNVKIINPNSQTPFTRPWELKDEDTAYYQAKYADAVKKSLLDSGLYAATTEPGADTLLLKAKILQIVPHASKDDSTGRPNLMKVYSEGFGSMIIAFEIYDSISGKLVATATDEHDLGVLWEENNRAQNNQQIRLAFDYWLNKLKRELTEAAKK